MLARTLLVCYFAFIYITGGGARATDSGSDSTCSDEDCDDDVSILQIAKDMKETALAASDAGHAQVTKPSMTMAQVEYPWSQRGRDYTQSQFTPFSAPTDLSVAPTWVWPNDLAEQVRHSPLIDNNKDIYVTTGYRIRKLSGATGKVIWTWNTDSHMVASPALYEGRLFAVVQPSITVYCINMTDGKTLYAKPHAREQDGDASSVFVYNDTVVFAVAPKSRTGELHNVYAVKAGDGSFLWEYEPDDVLWNFAPASPGDGTLLFSGSCGGVFRITFEGKQVWKVDRPNPPGKKGDSCGCGGGALGPNGVFYAMSNDGATLGFDEVTGRLSAHRVSDGKLLWCKTYKGDDNVGNQYPAVGKLTSGGPLAVIAPWGPFANARSSIPLSMMALNADTGDLIWHWKDPAVWPFKLSAGDRPAETANRMLEAKDGNKTEAMCAPDPQGIPLIAGDGTVYFSSSASGELRAIKDADNNGIIDPDAEVSTFVTHQCFLNSPSLAQGMLVAAPCWGPMYVWRDSTA